MMAGVFIDQCAKSWCNFYTLTWLKDRIKFTSRDFELRILCICTSIISSCSLGNIFTILLINLLLIKLDR